MKKQCKRWNQVVFEVFRRESDNLVDCMMPRAGTAALTENVTAVWKQCECGEG